MTENPRTPIVEVTIAAPFDAVWRALRDPAEIRRWHGWEYEDAGGLAAEIDAIYVKGASASRDTGTIEFDGLDHRFEVQERGPRATIVRVTKPGPAGDERWDEIEQGWISFVQQLRFFLERHAGHDRQTLMLSVEGAMPAAAALGIDERAPLFEAPFQRGFVIGDGDAVVILHTPPAGGGRIIAGAYGAAAAQAVAGLPSSSAPSSGRAPPKGTEPSGTVAAACPCASTTSSMRSRISTSRVIGSAPTSASARSRVGGILNGAPRTGSCRSARTIWSW